VKRNTSKQDRKSVNLFLSLVVSVFSLFIAKI